MFEINLISYQFRQSVFFVVLFLALCWAGFKLSSEPIIDAGQCGQPLSTCRNAVVLLTAKEFHSVAVNMTSGVRRQLVNRGIPTASQIPMEAIYYEAGTIDLTWRTKVEPIAKVVMLGDYDSAIDNLGSMRDVATVITVTREQQLDSLRSTINLVSGNAVIAAQIADLSKKQAEILQAMAKPNTRICVVHEDERAHPVIDALRDIGLAVSRIVATKLIIDRVSPALLIKGCDALFVPGDDIHVENSKDVAKILTETGIPILYERSLFVRDGGLLAYDADRDIVLSGMYDAVAEILKGLPARELPDVRAHRYNLAANRAAVAKLKKPLDPDLLRRITRWY